MHMKIGQFSCLTGVPEQTLRYYEDMGFLRPERNPQNGYRDYTQQNLLELLQVRMLRGLNVPVGKISSQPDICSILDDQQLVIEKQIVALEQELARLRRLQLRYSRETGSIRMQSIGGMYRLMLSDAAVHRHPQTPAIIKDWISLMPYCHFTIIIPCSELASPAGGPICPRWGIGVIQSYFEKFPSPPPAPAVYYGRFQGVGTNLCLQDPFHVQRDELAVFDAYMKENSLQYAGDMYGVLNYFDPIRHCCNMSLQVSVR